MLKYWPVLFFLVPLIEVYVLIQVGSVIGAGWTVLLIIITAMIGVNLLRHQGISTLMRANQLMSQGQIPAMEMLEGLVLAVGGAFLITPGFFTDIAGFFCLIPYTRQQFIKYILLNSTIQSAYSPHKENVYRQDSRIIEGEYKREDD